MVVDICGMVVHPTLRIWLYLVGIHDHPVFFWAIRPNFDHDSDSKGNQRDLPSHGHDRICDLGQQIYMIGGKRFTPIRSRT